MHQVPEPRTTATVQGNILHRHTDSLPIRCVAFKAVLHRSDLSDSNEDRIDVRPPLVRNPVTHKRLQFTIIIIILLLFLILSNVL